MKERLHDAAPRGELRADAAVHGTEESPEARGLSQTMRDPARRKRNASQKVNRIRPNGHGGESSSLTESPNEAKTNGKLDGSGLPAAQAGLPEREPAASDDVTGTTFAGDAAPTAGACAGRDACAEVAAPRSRSSAGRDEKSGTVDDRRPRASVDLAPLPAKKEKKAATRAREKEEPKEYPPGTGEPLALDAPGFVEQMHERVNLYEVYRDLLQAGDLKVKQRATEFLMEMKYGKGVASGADEITHVDVEFPKPQ